MAVVVATEEGKQAFRDGVPLIDNPYARYSDEFYWWNEGWRWVWWDTADWRPKNDGRRREHQ